MTVEQIISSTPIEKECIICGTKTKILPSVPEVCVSCITHHVALKLEQNERIADALESIADSLDMMRRNNG